MKSKKLLSVLLSFGMIMTAVAPAAMAKPVERVEASYSIYHEVRADEDAIIEMLKREGKIKEGASQEEISKILNEYLKVKDPANEKITSNREKMKHERMIEKTRQFAINNGSTEKVLKGEERYAQQIVEVQEEEGYTGTVMEVNPLVVLMDFADYTHESLTANETANFYEDFSAKHYQDMMFNEGTYKGPDGKTDLITMRQYYKEQSGGSIDINGGVAGWYGAKENAKYYGEDVGASHGIHARDLVKEAFEKVAADENVNLADYDKVNNVTGDRTPDGVIDYFIVIHAGKGQEAGGGTLGKDAIWSHKSIIWDGNDSDSPYTVTDHAGKTWGAHTYNINSQDGTTGLFCHEFGHALGLPDEYDTNYTADGEPVGNWSIMSGGSWVGTIGGTEPSGFSPRCKEFFQANYGGNWLHGETVKASEIPAEGIDLLLDQASSKGTNNDVVRIDLPMKERQIIKPFGKNVYYSQKGNDLNNSMVATVDLAGKTTATLKFKANYDIEEDWDYASVRVREVGAADDAWVNLASDITTTTNPNNQNPGNGITGKTDGWIDAEFDLSAFKGKNIEIMFHYWTDVAAANNGLYVDNIVVEADGQEIFNNGAEDENSQLTLNGFEITDGIKRANHYYLLEWRNHQGVDKGLSHIKWGGGEWSYDPGLVIWYVNEMYDEDDNWVGLHPGEGYIGVVDADQKSVMKILNDGTEMPVKYAELQIHDSAFSLRKGANLFLDYADYDRIDNDTFMHPYFDDSRDYSNKDNPTQGRILDNYGLKIYVTGESKDRSVARIHISKDEPIAEADK